MSDLKDLPPPPSYEEAQNLIAPSAPPAGPAQPVSYGHPAAGQPQPYAPQVAQPYPPQPSQPGAPPGGAYPPQPYQAGGPGHAGYPQAYPQYGVQPGQYSTGPMQPQYPTAGAYGGPSQTGLGYNPQQGTTYPVASVVPAGYNTTPMAYGTTSNIPDYSAARRRRIVFMVVFFVIFIIVFLSILFNVILRF